MRTLILTPDFPPAIGGIQLVMHSLVSNLTLADPEVVTLGVPGAEDFDAAIGIEVTRVGRKSEARNKLSMAALNLTGVRRGLTDRPDVVVGGHAVTAPATATLRAAGVPVIQYVHADEFRKRARLVRLALRWADAVVAVSGHAQALALDAGCAPESVRVIPPGVEPPPPASEPRAERPTMLTVARMQETYKGHDTIIRALPAIRRRVPDVQWVVIGDGRLRPELERMVRDLELGSAVKFLGAVSDEERDRWFDRAHLFAMPSRLPPGGKGGEGFGIVYLEAGGHGLPVVAGAVGGALDAVVDGETGVLVAPDDAEALAGAVAALLADPNRAAALGKAAREHARRFTWRRHAEAVEGLMRKVTEDR